MPASEIGRMLLQSYFALLDTHFEFSLVRSANGTILLIFFATRLIFPCFLFGTWDWFAVWVEWIVSFRYSVFYIRFPMGQYKCPGSTGGKPTNRKPRFPAAIVAGSNLDFYPVSDPGYLSVSVESKTAKICPIQTGKLTLSPRSPPRPPSTWLAPLVWLASARFDLCDLVMPAEDACVTPNFVISKDYCCHH